MSYSLKLISESVKTEGRGTSAVLRSYVVTKTGGAIDPAIDFEAMRSAGVLPAPMAPLSTGGFSTATLRETMRFRGVVDLFKPQRSAGSKLGIVLRWDTDYVERVKTGGTVRVLPSGLSRAGAMRYSNFWRLLWATNPPAASAFPDVEIGGTSVDTSLVPVRGVVPQANVVLWWIVDTSLISYATLNAVATEHEGRINDASFLGFSQGFILCEQFEVSRFREEYALCQMKVLYDSLYHHEQAVRNDADGRPKVNTSGKAKEVVWARPFYRMSNFADIIGAPGSGIISQDQYDFALAGETV